MVTMPREPLRSQSGGRGGIATAISRPTDEADNIKVAVRVRPPLPKESGSECGLWLSGQQLAVGGKTQSARGDDEECSMPRMFTFDRILDAQANQAKVFEVTGVNVVQNALDGYNGCLFAFGQTGSGKTFTLYGNGCSAKAWEDEHSAGVVPRLARELFRKAAELDDEVRVLASFLEIYNERLRDLLLPSGASDDHLLRSASTDATTSLQLRQHPQHGVSVRGLTECPIANDQDLQVLVEMANRRRATGATNLNSHSSRSHAVLRLRLRRSTVVNNDEGVPWLSAVAEGDSGEAAPWLPRASEKTAVVHLVDLAGSERAKKACTSGSRRIEGVHINSSLMVLGQVIAALTDRNVKRHAPFRQSRLTHLLQDSLSGNSRTFMIATVSSALENVEETMSTLRFAASVKKVRTFAQVNVVDELTLAALMQQHPPPPPPPRLLRVPTPHWPGESHELAEQMCNSVLEGSMESTMFTSRLGPEDSLTSERHLSRVWSLSPDKLATDGTHDAASSSDPGDAGEAWEAASIVSGQSSLTATGRQRLDWARLQQLTKAGVMPSSFGHNLQEAALVVDDANQQAGADGVDGVEDPRYELCALLPLSSGPMEMAARKWQCREEGVWTATSVATLHKNLRRAQSSMQFGTNSLEGMPGFADVSALQACASDELGSHDGTSRNGGELALKGAQKTPRTWAARAAEIRAEVWRHAAATATAALGEPGLQSSASAPLNVSPSFEKLGLSAGGCIAEAPEARCRWLQAWLARKARHASAAAQAASAEGIASAKCPPQAMEVRRHRSCSNGPIPANWEKRMPALPRTQATRQSSKSGDVKAEVKVVGKDACVSPETRKAPVTARLTSSGSGGPRRRNSYAPESVNPWLHQTARFTSVEADTPATHSRLSKPAHCVGSLDLSDAAQEVQVDAPPHVQPRYGATEGDSCSRQTSARHLGMRAHPKNIGVHDDLLRHTKRDNPGPSPARERYVAATPSIQRTPRNWVVQHPSSHSPRGRVLAPRGAATSPLSVPDNCTTSPSRCSSGLAAVTPRSTRAMPITVSSAWNHCASPAAMAAHFVEGQPKTQGPDMCSYRAEAR